MTALLWLDWRLFVNRVRVIRRNPRRLLPWLIFLVWLIPSLINRVVIGSQLRHLPAAHELAARLGPLAHLIPGVTLLPLGVAIWLSSASPPAAFQSPADARFVIGAGLDPRVVFAWLAVRTIRRLIVSFALLAVLLELLYLPWLGFGLLSALPIVLALVAYGGIVFGARLLTFNLQRFAPTHVMAALGVAITIAGAGATLAALARITGFGSPPIQLSRISDAIPPGSWMLQAFSGEAWAQMLLPATAVALVVAGVGLAGDSYPELWATSTKVFAIRRAMKARGGMLGFRSRRTDTAGQAHNRPTPKRQAESASGVNAPAGALIVLWTEWLAMRRGRGGLQLQVVLGVIAAAIGTALGVAASRNPSGASFLAANVALLIVLWGWGSGIRLGRDIGKPLWWLSGSALWARLTTWTLARGLRFAMPLLVFTEFAIAAYGRYLWALAPAPLVAFLLVWMGQTVGLASYAMLPARTDYRLANTMRFVAMYFLLVPLALAAVPGAVLHDVGLAIVLPILVVMATIFGLIAFATWRINGNGLVFAQEERQ